MPEIQPFGKKKTEQTKTILERSGIPVTVGE